MTSPPAAAPTSAATGTPAPLQVRPAWSRVWSKDAAMRALRATLVVPGLVQVERYGPRVFRLWSLPPVRNTVLDP